MSFVTETSLMHLRSGIQPLLRDGMLWTASLLKKKAKALLQYTNGTRSIASTPSTPTKRRLLTVRTSISSQTSLHTTSSIASNASTSTT